MRAYLIPVVLAVSLHAVLALLFVDLWGSEPEVKVKRPEHINATMVDLEALLAKRRAIENAKREAEQKRLADIARKKAAEQKRIADAKAKREAEAAAKRKAAQEKEAQRKAAAEAERKRIEKLKADAIAKKKAEADAKAAQQKREAEEKARAEEAARVAEAERKKAEEAQRLAALAAEQALLDQALAEEAALMQQAEEERVIKSYESYIRDTITRNWKRSPNARNGMVVEVAIRLLPTGYIDEAFVKQSSGDSRFDRDALTAVLKAESFPGLRDVDPVLFDRIFRSFTLKFRPEDLRN